MLGRASRTACPTWVKILEAGSGARAEVCGLSDTLNSKARLVHTTPATLSNPDNKPAPAGKDKNDPTNVKYDTPTKDPDDTPDYAPGYYDDQGKGGRHEVASGSSKTNPQDQTSHQQPVHTDKYKVEEHGDPARAKPEGVETDLSEMKSASKDANSAEDGSSPVGSSGDGHMPDQKSQTAGMPEPKAPPQEEQAGGYTPPKAETETPASDILNEGKVKEGKPAPARPDEPHKYKYQ